VRAAIGRVLKRLLPARYWTSIQSRRNRNLQLRWLNQHGCIEVAKRFSECNGPQVLHGVFAGMKYPMDSILSRHSVPMLVGSYERELYDIVAVALDTEYRRVIDVGSAEGYYAVGFALKGKSPVVAFETDGREAERCKAMSRINGVENRLEMRRWCSPEILEELAEGAPCFVLSDCEGFEMELFNERVIKALAHSDILIELHGEARDLLERRFAASHDVQIIPSSGRSANDYPELACLGPDAGRAVAEYRDQGQEWLYARARATTPELA
jgi:hypothetical protein